eukprot:7087463-Prymnesium_polylepis.1
MLSSRVSVPLCEPPLGAAEVVEVTRPLYPCHRNGAWAGLFADRAGRHISGTAVCPLLLACICCRLSYGLQLYPTESLRVAVESLSPSSSVRPVPASCLALRLFRNNARPFRNQSSSANQVAVLYYCLPLAKTLVASRPAPHLEA